LASGEKVDLGAAAAMPLQAASPMAGSGESADAARVVHFVAEKVRARDAMAVPAAEQVEQTA